MLKSLRIAAACPNPLRGSPLNRGKHHERSDRPAARPIAAFRPNPCTAQLNNCGSFAAIHRRWPARRTCVCTPDEGRIYHVFGIGVACGTPVRSGSRLIDLGLGCCWTRMMDLGLGCCCSPGLGGRARLAPIRGGNARDAHGSGCVCQGSGGTVGAYSAIRRAAGDATAAAYPAIGACSAVTISVATFCSIATTQSMKPKVRMMDLSWSSARRWGSCTAYSTRPARAVLS